MTHTLANPPHATPSVYLHTLGCRLNEAELERWANQFQSQGVAVTQQLEHADLVILNSCAVTREAMRKSGQILRRLRRNNASAHVIATGCYATLAPAEAAESGVDLVIANKDKESLVARALELIECTQMPQYATQPHAQNLFLRGKQRAFIKVQDGCRHRCSFCIVTQARGEERSRPLKELVEEVRTYVAQGIQECVLTGVHVGGYGSDINTDLHALVSALLNDTDIRRLRFASVEPWNLSPNFWTLFDNPRLAPHLHLPLQSGADSVLKRMARRGRSADFAALVEHARSRVAHFNITTDIITGFPGETEDEHQRSLAFAETMEFGHIHVFAYSEREGTGAAKMPNSVPVPLRKSRSAQFQALAAQSRQRCQEKALGRRTEVLLEAAVGSGSQQYYHGYSEDYLRVQLPGLALDSVRPGQCINVTLSHLSPDGQAIIGIA